MTKKYTNHLPNRVIAAFDILMAVSVLTIGVLIFLILFPFALLGMVGMGVWYGIKNLFKKYGWHER